MRPSWPDGATAFRCDRGWITSYVDAVGFALVDDTDVGDQTGGRVSLFLSTDPVAADHARMTAAGVRFLEQRRHERFGTVAVFAELHGATRDLIQPV